MSAECLQAVEAAETCILLQSKIEEMLCIDKNSVRISILSDNKSLVDSVHKSTSLENKRLQIDVNMLREMIEKREIAEFRWIPTEHQLANALTKLGASTHNLKQVLMNRGKYDHNSGVFVF